NEVPVGCVFVHNDEIIGRGMNDTNRSLCGTRHAEFIAIEHILLTYPPSIFAHTDLYVTVEPCIMCASALRQLHIRRVFFGCMNERFGGTGGVLKVNEDLAVINEPSYQVYGGINHDEAIMLLRRFYIQENDKAPQPIAKKTRKLKLEVAPFAGENKLTGVGEGTGGTPVVSPTDNTTATKTATTGESKTAEKAESGASGAQKEQTIAHEKEKKIEIEEVKEILEDDTKHDGGMACSTAVAAA
ncbi:cytidine deaminase-like protein, partial [Ascodesmis nigricans]